MTYPEFNFQTAEWDNPRKIRSREETVLLYYRSLFGKKRIPRDNQYWTLCGAHSKDGQKIDGELGQLIKTGFLRPNQFFGVDRDENIIENNKKFHPSANWIHGDFLWAMKEYAANENFNPAVINYDGISECKRGGRYVARILDFLDYNCGGETVLFANFVLESPYRDDRKYTEKEVLKSILENYRMPAHWSVHPVFYSYRGGASKNSGSTMATFVFVKVIHDEILFTEGSRNLLLAPLPS